MTDRYVALTVALEKDTREDDAESLIVAIKQLRGVADVTGHVTNPKAWAIEHRVRHEIREKPWHVLYQECEDDH